MVLRWTFSTVMLKTAMLFLVLLVQCSCLEMNIGTDLFHKHRVDEEEQEVRLVLK